MWMVGRGKAGGGFCEVNDQGDNGISGAAIVPIFQVRDFNKNIC